MQMQPFDMATVIEDVGRSARVLAGDRVSVVARTLGEDIRVKGDMDRIKQVVLNLTENALKYTPEGGQVSILCQHSDHDLVSIAVTDTGMGIPEADLPHVFERFYRVDKSRSRAHGGAGLGLSIATSIVQNHGGRIIVNSKEGVGTTFEVLLPAYHGGLTAH
jgi:signal transduction histidine kinase